jgi:hypothetical protein
MAAIYRPWLERYLEARRHAVAGRGVIKRQREFIAREKAKGLSTDRSEDLLALFQQTQVIFEGDLARISAERG